MQSLIMQANVHRLASLMASHQQRAYRTYGAIWGVGETFVPTLLPDGEHRSFRNGCKTLLVTQMKDHINCLKSSLKV